MFFCRSMSGRLALRLRGVRRLAFAAGALFFSAQSLVSLCQQASQGIAGLLGTAQAEEDRGEVIGAIGHYKVALQLDPRNADALYRLGRLLARSRDFAAAEASFREAIQVRPDWAEAHYNLGLALIAASPTSPDWTEATPEFSAALKLRPAYVEAANMLAVSQIETGQFAGALQVAKAALALDSRSAELHFNYGRALESTGQAEEAGAEYAAALKIRADYPEAESSLANLCFERHDYASAAQHFEAALASNPDLERAHFGLAKAWKALKENEQAQVEFRQANALIQRQSDAVMSSHLSNESLDLAKAGDFAKAVESARKSLSLDPANANAHDNLGLLLADTGDLRGGIAEVRKSVSLVPARLSAYVDMARMQLKLNDRAAARASLERAGLLDAQDPRVKNGLAMLRETPTASGAGLEPSATAFPFGAPEDSPAGHLAFAMELKKEGDDAGAIGELRRALALRPTDSQARYQLGLAYSRAGDLQDAQLELRKILYSTPHSVETHMALGRLFIDSREYPKAVRELKEVLRDRPGNAEASQLLARAEPLAKTP
jgi:tetratricopeptide (TPR) repeat protein